MSTKSQPRIRKERAYPYAISLYPSTIKLLKEMASLTGRSEAFLIRRMIELAATDAPR